MKSTDQNKSVEERSIPVGFSIEELETDALVIHHKRTGMGCMNIFLIVWLIGWSICGVILLAQYLTGKSGSQGGEPTALWEVLFFLIAEVFVGYVLLSSLFGKQSFRIESAHLTMETDVLGFRRRSTIARHSIKRIVQIKDGGDGDDSFPSWGLKLEGEKQNTLIDRQPYEKSHWLGAVLAKWAGVDFVEAPKT